MESPDDVRLRRLEALERQVFDLFLRQAVAQRDLERLRKGPDLESLLLSGGSAAVTIASVLTASAGGAAAVAGGGLLLGAWGVLRLIGRDHEIDQQERELRREVAEIQTLLDAAARERDRLRRRSP